MFIYSNHYLIISKLTQENFKDYSIDHFFTIPFLLKDALDMNYIFHEPLLNPYTGVDNDTYKFLDYHDSIDLTSYEFESINFFKVKDDTLDSVKENHSAFFHAEREQNHIEHFDDIRIINDLNHHSQLSDPFRSLTWCYAFTYFKGITRADRKIQKKEIRDKIIKNKLRSVFRPRPAPSLVFRENIEVFYFPDPEDSDDELDCVYFLNDYTFDYMPGADNYLDEGHELNNVTTLSSTIDLDNCDSEYWHEPIFIYPLIREWHYYRDEKDFFKNRFTGTSVRDWHAIGEFDHSPNRYS